MIYARFRRRASSSEQVAELHTALIERLSGALLGTVAEIHPAQVYFESENQFSGAADLTPSFADGKFRGAISYCPRAAINADHGMFDDVLTVCIPESVGTYRIFVEELFRPVASAFEVYRAGIYPDEDLDLDDFDQIADLSQRTGKDVDGRDGVFRVTPANAFDDQLCQRAFGLNPENVVRRVAPHAQFADVIDGRAFFVVTSRIVGRKDLIALDRTIRRALT